MKPAATWEAIGSIKPWPGNPRTNEAAVDAVLASMKRFGFGSPIVAREGDRVIIAGHTRHEAAKRLGLDKVPVRFMPLDPAQARALNLADNKLGELAGWDEAALADVLEELEADGLDLAGLGWSDDELEQLLKPEPEPEPEPDTSNDDRIPDEVPATTRAGDVITIGRHTLHCGDCLEVMRGLGDSSIDSIVCDPPYGIGFMGKGWDVAVPGDEWARECLRVLKPGGHLVAFAATRTVHRLMVNLEDAGLEIRDIVGWLQWQGFPKSLDASKAIDAMHGAEREVVGHDSRAAKRTPAVNTCTYGDYRGQSGKITAPSTDDAKRWHGWGTALKPAFEPAVLARKPLEGTVAANVLKWGTGAINIDGCRIDYDDNAWPGPGARVQNIGRGASTLHGPHSGPVEVVQMSDLGRWPANIYHCPKPSRGEREAGCDGLAEKVAQSGMSPAMPVDDDGKQRDRFKVRARNIHPTVKPSRLMAWLVRLVSPPGGTVLEPFAGSGTTMLACERERMTCIGVEMEPGYCDIIRARLAHVVSDG